MTQRAVVAVLAAFLLVHGAASRSLSASISEVGPESEPSQHTHAAPVEAKLTNEDEAQPSEQNADATVASSYEENLATFSNNNILIASGALDPSNPYRADLAKIVWSDNIVIDFRYPLTYPLKMLGIFNGIDECLSFLDGFSYSDVIQWLKYLTLSVSEGPEESAVVVVDVKAHSPDTGLSTPDIRILSHISYEGSKGKTADYYMAPPFFAVDYVLAGSESMLENMMELSSEQQMSNGAWEDNLAVFYEAMSAWGRGELLESNPDRAALAAKYYSEDIVFDARLPSKTTDGWRMYMGLEDSLNWIDWLATWEQKDFTIDFVVKGPHGTVLAKSSYIPVVNGVEGNRTSFFHQVAVQDGKISSWVFYWGNNAEEVNALF